MARLLALEWDDVEARVAVAATRGDAIVFEHAFPVSLVPADDGQDEVDVGARIAAALAARRLGRIDAIVAVGRSDIELRPLSLPPAPDDEVPDLVRFQAAREFNELDDDWPLDFLPLRDDPEQGREVLAATIKPELVGKVLAICERAAIKPSRLVLRPCSAASLLCRRMPSPAEQVRLLVDISAGEADLTVIVEGKVFFLRRARLARDPLATPGAADALLSEIRRTMPAVQSQLSGRRVESVVLCGATAEHRAMAEAYASQLAPSVEVFDPFEGLRREGELARALPEDPGRYASLIGMLWDELEQRSHAFDFLNPRRRPAPRSRRNTFATAGLAVATLVLVGILGGWLYARKLQDDVRRLNVQSADLDQRLDAAAALQQLSAELDRWAYPNVAWLEELHRLAANFPDSRRAMLTDLDMLPHPEGAEFKLQGLARDVQSIEDLEKYLTANVVFSSGSSEKREDIEPDPSRIIVGKNKQGDKSNSQYPWQFSSSLVIKREKP